MTFIDTHAHIYDEKFKQDIGEMLERSQQEGVNKIYMPNIDHTSVDSMLELEEKYPDRCIPMMGLHPCSVGKDFEKELYQVETWLSQRKFVAVGEIGIDLYWDKTFFEQQQEAFRIQIEWAKKYQIPIIIHTRNATQEAIDIVKRLKDENLRGIFHCFGGSLDEAQQIIDLDFYLGIGGVLTFKNSKLDQVLKHIDIEHLVLETDSPYLAPTPYRGKRNESSYIPLIAQKLAEIKEMKLEEIAQQTTTNALNLFK